MKSQRPDHIPAIAAVMTPFPWYIHIEDRLSRAREVMEEQGIRHLPVTEEGALVGVVTERDLRLLEGTGRGEALSVRDACVRDAYVVQVNTRLDEVLLEMARRHIGSALVVKNDKLAGIFTVTDACRSFGQFLRELFPEPDDEIA
jgi:acetoin utilization protein AcuB